MCLEVGFDGVVLGDVARRAGVTANAIYRHFESRTALLAASARRALSELPVPRFQATEDAPERARRVMRAFLSPRGADVRRFITEVNLAARRSPDLAEMLAEWNKETVPGWLALTGSGPESRAMVKSFYLLLLGACHLESVDAIRAPRPLVAEALEDAAAHLFERVTTPSAGPRK